MAIITLTTDFGDKDPSVAILKGGLLSKLGELIIVDISHQISPFDIHQAAYILNAAYTKFPKGTIHLIGVDAEQTPEQKHLAALLNGHYFISADNGIFSLLASRKDFEKMVSISLSENSEGTISTTEIFVQTAGHIANGGTLEVLGKPIHAIKEVKGLAPYLNTSGTTITGHVIYIDNYGNVVTNISKHWFELIRRGRPYEILARNYKFKTVYNTYHESLNFEKSREERNDDGKKVALFNHSGFLELAIYRSNLKTVGGASTLLGLNYRDTIIINFL